MERIETIIDDRTISIEAGELAKQAGGSVVTRAVLPRDPAVRIVAREAIQPGIAFGKASALAKSVGMVIDLEPFRLRFAALEDVQVHKIFVERFAGAVRIVRPSEGPYARDGGRGLIVTLVADFNPARIVHLRRVCD